MLVDNKNIDIDSIDEKCARKLIDKILVVLSNHSHAGLTFKCGWNSRNGLCSIMFYIVTKWSEIAMTGYCYADPAKNCLKAMLEPGATINFFSNDCGDVMTINLNDFFGTTLHELYINLDLSIA